MEGLDLALDIKEFLYYSEFAVGKSLNTVKSLRIDLNRFNEYILKLKNIKKIEDIDSFNFREYIIELQSENVGKRSINRKLSSMRSFFKYLKEIGKIQKDLAHILISPNFTKEIPEILTLDEIKKLRESIKIKNYHSLRDRLIIELLYSSGITSQELLSLGENLFDLEKRELTVLGNKKNRVVYFSERAREYFIRYTEAKKERLKEKYSKEILFVNGSGDRLSDRSLRRLIDRYAIKIGIEREISPHTFRHTFAVHLLEHGFTLEELQELLGVVNFESVKIYKAILERKKRTNLKGEYA